MSVPSERCQADNGSDDAVPDGHRRGVFGQFLVMIYKEACVRSGTDDRDSFDIPFSFWIRALMNTKAKKPAARVSNKENMKTPRRAGRQHRKWVRDMSSSKGDEGRRCGGGWVGWVIMLNASTSDRTYNKPGFNEAMSDNWGTTCGILHKLTQVVRI